MGKGYHNYMSKKFFHPGNFDNIKRVWMAEQKAAHDKKQDEDTLTQYLKEQDMYQNRALLGDEKAKLGLNFMYDPPPGVRRDREKEEDEPEYKFEWQRKYNAPRESYAKGDDTVRDQPFGIEVRNVRCLKCRKWGHINTDKVCPLFGKSITAEPPQSRGNHPGELMEQMKEDGLEFTKKVLSRQNDPTADNQQMIDSEAEDDEEISFFLSLTRKEKKKLVKKLEKQRKKEKNARRKERKLNNMEEVTKQTIEGRRESDANRDSKRDSRKNENSRDESNEEKDDKSKYYSNGTRRTTAKERSIERLCHVTNRDQLSQSPSRNSRRKRSPNPQHRKRPVTPVKHSGSPDTKKHRRSNSHEAKHRRSRERSKSLKRKRSVSRERRRVASPRGHGRSQSSGNQRSGQRRSRSYSPEERKRKEQRSDSQDRSNRK